MEPTDDDLKRMRSWPDQSRYCDYTINGVPILTPREYADIPGFWETDQGKGRKLVTMLGLKTGR